MSTPSTTPLGLAMDPQLTLHIKSIEESIDRHASVLRRLRAQGTESVVWSGNRKDVV
jgi:hypothetical protein